MDVRVDVWIKNDNKTCFPCTPKGLEKYILEREKKFTQLS